MPFSSFEYHPVFSNGLVQEFFTENHWSKLPPLWQSCLRVTPLPSFCHQLLHLPAVTADQDYVHAPTSIVLPLSLLAFAALARALSYQRQPQTMHTHKSDNHHRDLSSCSSAVPNGHQMTKGIGCSTSQIAALDHSFRRHVKPKKQHEIMRLAEVNGLGKKKGRERKREGGRERERERERGRDREREREDGRKGEIFFSYHFL